MKKKKLLLVDDEINFLELFGRRLQKNGYDVVKLFNADEALAKISTEKPDAVLLDILMPGIDGFQVFKKIREQNKQLPVFIMTAFSNEERFDAAGKLNAAGFIQKNDDLQKAIDEITDILSISGQPGS